MVAGPLDQRLNLAALAVSCPRKGVLYAVFFVLNGIGLGIQLACIAFTYYLLDMHGKLAYNAALIFGIGLGTLFRFWFYRQWVWLAPPLAEAEAMAADGQPSPTGSPVAARSPAWPPTSAGDENGHPSDMRHTNENAHGKVNRG